VPLGLALAVATACRGRAAGAADDDAVVPAVDAGEDSVCATDDDCAFGERCRDGACEAASADVVDVGCVSDDECDGGEICAVSTGRCVSEAPVPNVPTGPPGPCADDEERTCGIKVGVCEYGIEQCSEGEWSGACLGAIGPSLERCNGADDDCNGDDDDGFGVGDGCTHGSGACAHAGLVACGADRESTFCDALPVVGDACNGVDDDGDGCTDEGFDLAVPCTQGLGACARDGVTVCNGSGDGVACNAVAGTPASESCDGVDEDCNGVVDDGCDDDLDGHCDAVLGVFAALPIAACPLTTSTAALDCDDGDVDVHPGAIEACGDGRDSNCDLDANDGFALEVPCTAGLGSCERAGGTVCNAGGDGVTCGAIAGAPAQEACDGVDQDCDGALDNGCDDDGDGHCDARLAFLSGALPLAVCPQTSSHLALDCDDDDAAAHPGIDADFDGANRCADCDETNGAVFPGATELCDGIDNNCDGVFDDGFDIDGDGFTTCATLSGGGLDAAARDCDDGDAQTYPGACELCASGALAVCDALNSGGNGVDEDCNGYLDEPCAGCNAADQDGDGMSACAGDCAPTDPSVRTGNAEVCDGKDTDCNKFTTENCDVSDPCNFAGAVDVCKDRLQCIRQLSNNTFLCTSFCNATTSGLGLGDSCAADETCGMSLTPTDNVHGCQITTGFGALVAGEACVAGDCRSGNCANDSRFGLSYCTDFCGSDRYCPTSPVVTTCQASVGDSASCLRVHPTQTRSPGDACTSGTASECANGSASCVGGACRDICCSAGDCPSGERCALEGATTPGPPDVGGVDTVPICLPVGAGNQGRAAGAACNVSDECASEFCDISLGVCVETCCNDATCPAGLLCDLVIVTLTSGSQTFGRMCLSSTPAVPLEAR
jgi:hypothetical protein